MIQIMRPDYSNLEFYSNKDIINIIIYIISFNKNNFNNIMMNKLITKIYA